LHNASAVAAAVTSS